MRNQRALVLVHGSLAKASPTGVPGWGWQQPALVAPS
jgi:hypothetical protein